MSGLDLVFGYSHPPPSNVCRGLAQREQGLSHLRRRDPRKHSRGLLRRLLLSGQRQFSAGTDSPIVTQGDSIYADGKILVRNNATKCYDCLCVHDLRKKLYSLSMRPKWLDQELWAGPLTASAVPPLEGDQHRPALILLRDDNTLHVHDASDGKEMTSVFLAGPTTKFKEMCCNEETATVVLKSTRPKSTGNASDVLMSFLVFRHPPLKFLAHFRVCKSVFGANVTDASVHHNLLVVMHSDGQIKCYSIEYILEKFQTRQYSLDEIVDNDITLRVGQKPVGLPVNVHINHLPPVLFQTKSRHHYLQIGSIPWKYLISETEGKFTLRDLCTSDRVIDGTLSRVDETEQDLIFFHPDDSARILHSAEGECRIYDIVSTADSSSGSLVKTFTFIPKFGDDSDNDEVFATSSRLQSLSTTSSSGRRLLRPPTYTANSTSEIRRDIAIDYEDELDVMAVLGVTEYADSDGDGDSVHTRLDAVTLVDNKTYATLRRIPIGEVLRQATDVSNVRVTLDRDVLVMTVKSTVKSTAYVYRLRSNEEVEKLMVSTEDDSLGLAELRRRRSRRRRRPVQDARTLRRRSTWNEPFRVGGEFDTSGEDTDDGGSAERAPAVAVLPTARVTRNRNQSSGGAVR